MIDAHVIFYIKIKFSEVPVSTNFIFYFQTPQAL